MSQRLTARVVRHDDRPSTVTVVDNDPDDHSDLATGEFVVLEERADGWHEVHRWCRPDA